MGLNGLCKASEILSRAGQGIIIIPKTKTFLFHFLNKMSSSVAEANHTEKEESLRLAIAVSLVRSKFQNRQSSSSSTSRCDVPSESDALRWKQKVNFSIFLYLGLTAFSFLSATICEIR